jgi:hypothetical protein
MNRLIIRRNFERRKTPARIMRRRGWPRTRKIEGLKPIIDHNNGTDGLKKQTRRAVNPPSNNEEAL